MPAAEIIAIGTELLLGEIFDTNTRFLARTLRDHGIDLYRTSIVGDNAERISQAIRESLKRCQIIITTGGLGPTVDDPTRQAIAMAFDRETEFHPELWDQIQDRFKRFNRIPTENNRRQAYIPAGSLAIENPVGTAPGFIVEQGDTCVISLPGVPREMEYLVEHKVLPYLKEHYQLHGTIQARVLHVSGLGESQVDEYVGDLEQLSNPTLGLLAHPGQTDLRITAKADSVEEARRMIQEVEAVIRQRVGDSIFGVDAETLEVVTLQAIQARGWKMVLAEAGLNGTLINRLTALGFNVDQARILPAPCPAETLQQTLDELAAAHQAQIGLGVGLISMAEQQILNLVLVLPGEKIEETRYYGGAAPLGIQWAANTSLDLVRRKLRQAA